jgi:membrane protein
MQSFFTLLREAFKSWQSEDIVRMAGSLSYFAGLSILPLLLVGTALASMVFGSAVVENQIVRALQGVVGGESAETVRDAVSHITGEGGTNTLTTLVSAALLIYSSTHFFRHLRSSLRIIWEERKAGSGDVKSFVKDTAISLVTVIGAGLLLLVVLLVNTGLFFALQSLDAMLPGSNYLRVWQALGAVLLYSGAVVLFAALYKLLPNAPITWRQVWVGAGITALIFTVGQFLMVLYLRGSQIDTIYGAAGALVIILIWVNVIAHILIFGAVLTKTYARRQGAQVVSKAPTRTPAEGAAGS